MTVEEDGRDASEAAGHFSFAACAERFDEHINRSIRGYAWLRDDIVSLSRYFVENETRVVDIGCSQGTLIRRIRDINVQAGNARYFGIDIDPAFSGHWQDAEGLEYQVSDVRGWDGLHNLSFVTALFTLQFIPQQDRLGLLRRIHEQLIEGGGLVLSEKVFSDSSRIQNMMEFLYYDYKRQFFSEKHILDKERELRHLAKLGTEAWLFEQLRTVGFRDIQAFWRNFNFIGVVAIK